MIFINNKTIKEAIKNAHLFQWQVADKLGVSEQTLIRWLRKEVSSEKETEILKVIDELKAGDTNASQTENN